MEMAKRSEVIDAITEKGMKDTCPACAKSGTWIVPRRQHDSDELEVMMMLRRDSISDGFAFVPMICSHCGFTQFLHLDTLMKAGE
jgi:hypothetical protein